MEKERYVSAGNAAQTLGITLEEVIESIKRAGIKDLIGGEYGGGLVGARLAAYEDQGAATGVPTSVSYHPAIEPATAPPAWRISGV